MTGVLTKKGTFGLRDRHAWKEDGLETQTEGHLQAQECLRLPEAGREVWSRFSHTAQRSQPC